MLPVWSYLMAGGELKVYGTFLNDSNDEKEAARAYDNAARHHFGQYANRNFPADRRCNPAGCGTSEQQKIT
ncbi:MAG: AP2/ERF family transcription factor [Planctomycetota bacterium]|jgi:hypothetical protein